MSHPLPDFLTVAAAETSARPARRDGSRFMLSDQIEHRCQTLEITPTGAALRAPVRGRVGEQVICYLDRYGRMEGRIARLTEDGFAIAFTSPERKREKLAEQLARSPDDDGAERRHDRIEPNQKRAVVRVPDGRHIAAQIINLSLSGAALTCPVLLEAGSRVMVGRRAATVTRATQRLVAVAFETPLTPAEFRPDIVL